MRTDPPGSLLTQRNREPRLVVGIIYETGSIYFTSRAGLTSVPGNVIYASIEDISSTTQELFPEDGRATIGSLSFSVVDLAGAITDELRDQLLTFDRGTRLKEVRIFDGDTDDFLTFSRVATYVIDAAVEVNEGTYRFSCSDRTREMRADCFVQVGTRLTLSLGLADTVLSVQNTDGFEMVQHTASFTDAPGELVGYVKVRKTSEIIRYTAKTSGQFSGCTRECFGTRAQEVVIEPSTEADKLPEIEEFIYLEMPGPQLLYAVQTGKIRGTATFLPVTWTLGIAEANVVGSTYDSIGSDLYDPADLNNGLILRFTHLQKTDGKRFCEEQLHVPMATFGPIDSYGRIGLKRLPALLSTASTVATIDHTNLISYDGIKYAQNRVINEVSFDWNFDGEEYTRTEVLINAGSIDTHGEGEQKSYEFSGLSVSRHSRATIQRIMNTLTDRFGAPPIEIDAEVSSTLNRLEIGDVVRVQLPDMRDHTSASTLNRAFEVQSVNHNRVTGEVRLKLFGSTARMQPDVLAGTTTNLSDAWMIGAGTNLASVLTIVAGHVTANGSITGNDDLRDAIFYYDGDLTINAGVTVLISANVQLRITGELTINGTISGIGNGEQPISDPNTVTTEQVQPTVAAGFYTPGTMGQTGSQGGMGITAFSGFGIFNGEAGVLRAGVPALTRLSLEVIGGELFGLPADLRGTAGMYGEPTVSVGFTPPSRIVKVKGGAGGAGGAGLMVICRGLSWGANGRVNLSGVTGAVGVNSTFGSHSTYSGSGAGGASGGFFVLLDGDTITLPDFDTQFISLRGASPPTGTAIQSVPIVDPVDTTEPWSSYQRGLPAEDTWQAMHFAQYIPRDAALGEADDEIVPAPENFVVVGAITGAQLSWTPPPENKYHYIEIYESIDNDRVNSIRIALVRGDSYLVTSESEVVRYYWIRAVKTGIGHSQWVPIDPGGGAPATFGGGTTGPPGQDAINVSITASNGLQFTQAPNGGAWSGTTTDVTFTFLQAGAVIATHTIRVTRTAGNLAGATVNETGDPTTENVASGTGTPVLTLIVTHDASGVTFTQTVIAVQGGTQGATGPAGADGSSGDGTWTPVISAGMIKTGKSFKKIAPAGWDAGFHSVERYGSCVVTFEPHQNNSYFMIGLSTNQAASFAYDTIQFAWYCVADGTLQIYESGGPVTVPGTYAAGDTFTVQYDGSHVRYTHNGIVVRTVPFAGGKLGADSSFYTQDGQADNVMFNAVDAGKIDLTTQIFNQLTAAFADAGLVNQNISIAANGALVGAGGGAPVISSLAGSVAVGQMTTNVLAALQAVIGNLSAIHAELGTVVISTTGHLRSGQTAYNTGTGFFLGFVSGSPVFSIGNPSGNRITFDGSNIEIVPRVQTFTPSWNTNQWDSGTPPTGDISYIDLGSIVIMYNTDHQFATSGGAQPTQLTWLASTLPAAIRPAATRTVQCVVNDGTNKPGSVTFDPDGSAIFECLKTGQFDSGGWTGGGTAKGLYRGWSVLFPK